MIDARRGEVFTTGPRVCRPEELDVDGLTLVGDGAIRYRAIFEAHGASIPPDDDPAHLPDALLLIDRAGTFGAAELVEPLYVREPDAKPSRDRGRVEIRTLDARRLSRDRGDRAARLPDAVVALDVRVRACEADVDLPRRVRGRRSSSATSSTRATSTRGT